VGACLSYISYPAVCIPLSNSTKFVTIDAEDAYLVAGRAWCLKNGYAATALHVSGRTRGVFLHRVIMASALAGSPDGTEVDHENGDKLDCRRGNLRLATHAQNMRNRGLQSNNTSGFKGVSWDRQRRAWQAKIRVDGRQVKLGRFRSPESAAAAYVAAARQLHGDFARY
jgi:hypothetical protein